MAMSFSMPPTRWMKRASPGVAQTRAWVCGFTQVNLRDRVTLAEALIDCLIDGAIGGAPGNHNQATLDSLFEFLRRQEIGNACDFHPA